MTLRSSAASAVTSESTPLEVLVVIPTYNEVENLGTMVRQVLDLGDEYGVLIVDDDSPDGTGALADELAEEFEERTTVVHRAQKQGLGRAYVEGFTAALETGVPLVAQMDADLSHHPLDLRRMVEAMMDDIDLVVGSRYVPGGSTRGWPWHRRLVSRAGGLYAGRVLGLDIRDLTGGFKVWRRDTLEAIGLDDITSDGYGFQIETTYRAVCNGAHVAQVPIVFHDRVAGKSKLSRKVVFEAAVKVWAFRFRR